ncbi:MAG: cyclic pyranopterin monophosphate synthase MoaC [Shimia sp.]
MSGLTHFDATGAAHMVDITGKSVTDRIATATGHVEMAEATMAHVRAGSAKKGDVLGTARLAGIMGAKRTADLIPLCHPLPLSNLAIDFDMTATRVTVTATVRTTGRTGVEMEALTAVSTACLTIFDMLKAVDKGMKIGGIRVTLKDGGKSGRFEAP